MLSRLLDLLFPWRVPMREAREEIARTNRSLEILIAALEQRVAKLPEVHHGR